MTDQTLTIPPSARAGAARSDHVAGWWNANGAPALAGEAALRTALHNIGSPVYIVDQDGEAAVASDGTAVLGERLRFADEQARRLIAYVPPLRPEAMGDPAFRETHGVRFAYIAGEMANGIGSAAMVEAMAQAGMLGFFGAAGLMPDRIEAAIDRIQDTLGCQAGDGLPYGFNLIHSPSEPDLEAATADLYVRRGVRLVSASAYLDLTLPLVRYRVSGIHRGPDGAIVTPNQVVAKVSRVEVARKFFAPPPAAMVAALVQQGAISREEASLASYVPVAEDLTAEADSGGHTDNRPLVALLPTMLALRDEMMARHEFARAIGGAERSLRVGAAGGISTPASVAAAIAMGAAYVLTGSINQACVEAGTSEPVKEMLAKAGQADVMMAPAADMFEMGVKVQVLKWGTMFGVRAQKLYELYRNYESLEAIPAAQRAALERDHFKCTLEQAWEGTRQFFEQRDPRQLERAAREPKHKMALVFRAYLGQSSKWAIGGDAARRADYQVWCGPAMGAFNEWTRGTFLEDPARRNVVTVAMNLMVGACVTTRAAWLRAQGVRVPARAERFAPMELEELIAMGAAT